MGQTFTVNLSGDFIQFQVIKLQEAGDGVESQILLQSRTVTLCKPRRGKWQLKSQAFPIMNELVEAIGNSIASRYLIF